ncbi:MAG: flippase [Victivallales bacterium]
MLKQKFNNITALLREWMGNMLVRQYGKNVLWMLSARFFWIISAFTVGIYAARRLGPYRLGLLNYAIAFTGLLAIIASMNLGDFVIRQLVNHPERRDRILGNFFMLRLILFVIMGAILGAALFFFNIAPEIRQLCVILGIGYLGFTMQGCALYFQARVESKYYAIAQLAACLTSNVIRGCAAWYEWPLVYFAAAEASINLISFGGCLPFFLWRAGSPLRWNFAWKEIRQLLFVAWPLAIRSIFSLVYAQTDQLMLKYFLGAQSVGYYSLATRFTENWALFISLLSVSFFPAIIGASKISPEAYRKQLHRLYFLVFWSMAAAAGVTVLLGYPFILLLYGRPFLPAVPVLYIYVWSLLGTSLLAVFCQWAINEKRLVMIGWALGTGTLINVILNPLLIKAIGITGAAWSTLLSMPLGLALTLFCSRCGREHIVLMLRSIFTIPSFRLDKQNTA